MNNYPRFLLMIAVSTLCMYCLTYLNTYTADHIYFSETRAYMALIMGSMMALVMLFFMRGMYQHKTMNVSVIVGALAIFCVSLWLVRSQRSVDEVSYMRAMIPHHSIAILTSERARIEDPRVRELADGIIDTQKKEIAEMKRLIGDLDR